MVVGDLDEVNADFVRIVYPRLDQTPWFEGRSTCHRNPPGAELGYRSRGITNLQPERHTLGSSTPRIPMAHYLDQSPAGEEDGAAVRSRPELSGDGQP